MPNAAEIDGHPASDPVESSSGIHRRWGGATILWATLACLLLISSAVVRDVQERRHQDEASYLESCPFPLKQVPTTLGAWKLSTDGDQTLDKLTMRITGGTDHFLRTYVNELTGVKLVVLLLFGPVEPVVPHTPEVCYPANGFGGAEEPVIRQFKYATPDTPSAEHIASFRSAVYQKPGLRTIREGVYYSFRLNGQWSPDVAAGRKFPRRNPGVFKLQIQRMMADQEQRGPSKLIDAEPGKDLIDPIEDFLMVLVPEVEREIAAASMPPTSTAAK